VVRVRAKEAPLKRMRRAGLAAMAALAALAARAGGEGGDGGVDGGLIMLRMMQRLCRRHRQTAPPDGRAARPGAQDQRATGGARPGPGRGRRSAVRKGGPAACAKFQQRKI
jgi:hypothetical protein